MNPLEDSDFVAGFRPEALLPAAAVQEDHAPVRFRVTLIEYLGSERILHGVVEGGRFDGRKAVSRLARRASAGYDAGNAYDFAVAERDLKFFDKATGKRTGRRALAWR
jgi:multiple sugar transport system ATP-binding protein